MNGKYCFAFCEESFEGCFNTFEDAFEEALEEAYAERETGKETIGFFVGEVVDKSASDFVHIDSFLEDVNESAWDQGGEHAEEYPSLKSEQEKELKDIICAYLDDKSPTYFWGVTNTREFRLFPDNTHTEVEREEVNK